MRKGREAHKMGTLKDNWPPKSQDLKKSYSHGAFGQEKEQLSATTMSYLNALYSIVSPGFKA